MNLENMKVKEIKDWLQSMDIEESIEYSSDLKSDKRESIKKLADKLEKKYKGYLCEIERVKKLWKYENSIIEAGFQLVAGIDEAGRGPLAGPVVAAAVILPHNIFIEGVNDSKKISSKKRDELFDIITQKAVAIGVGIVDHEMIDEINILNATKLAMRRAVENLSDIPEYLLIDALRLADIDIKQVSIVQGDAKSISIAAASIIAKVTRDRIMDKYDLEYPQYGFLKHKGYGTKLHYENIDNHGLSQIHRKSFLKKYNR